MKTRWYALMAFAILSIVVFGGSRRMLHGYVKNIPMPPSISFEQTTAAFSGSITSGLRPLTVVFTDASSGGATTWAWDFGDGSTSTDQNPTHQYTTAGTYTVTLTASNPDYSDDEAKASYVTVVNPYDAMTSFVVNMSAGKMMAKTLTFPANATVSVRFINVATSTQIGTTKTVGPGTILTPAGVTVSDGVEVRIEYTCTTANPSYANVTEWTLMGIYVMTNGIGDSTTQTPSSP